MKPISVVAVLIAVFTASGSWLEAYAQNETEDAGKLTVPWTEFKKLLNLEDDDIVLSLETFQKLLAQTGTQTTPPHAVKGGHVVLSRAEFDRLVGQMKPPPDAGTTPPFDHLITKAVYTGKMKRNSTEFEAVFDVHVLKKDAYVKVPILPAGTALADVRVGGDPALVVVERGYHQVVLPRAGEYVVTATYSVKSSLDKGPYKIDLAIAPTPITLLTLEMPIEGIDFEIPQAQQIVTEKRRHATAVSAVIGQSSAISVRWRKEVAVAEKVPPKLYAEVHHLISIQDDAFKTHSVVNYTILHSEVDAVRVVIPHDVNVLSVSGEGVGEWQEVTEDEERVLLIPFTYGKKGAAGVSITTETAFSESGLTSAFAGLRTLDTVRETGFIGVELATSAEVVASDSDGLEAVAVQKLPAPLVNRSARPLIMGFKYLKHPYSLVFDITKHEKIAVPVATIHSASVVTLFTEDGKLVHRLVYQVRNNAKQFLEIQLPAETDVWSVFVDNQPVESSVSKKGMLLVPLIRSRSVDAGLDTFPVEVIYCTVRPRFSPFGKQAAVLPAVDLLTSQLIWSVYLPNDYSYVYFQSTLEKEEMIRGVNVSTGKRRTYDEDAMRELRMGAADGVDQEEMKRAYKGGLAQSSFRNVPMEKDQLASQMNAELEFSGRLEGLAEVPAPVTGGAAAPGVLPIHIRIPTGGQVYRFARTIIQPEDPLSFSVVYTRVWVIELMRWLIAVLIALVVYLNRNRLMGIGRWAGAWIRRASAWLRQHERVLGRYAQSVMTPFVLLGLVLVFRNVSLLLTMLCFFLLWVSIAYHAIRFGRKRLQLRSAAKSPAGQSGATR